MNQQVLKAYIQAYKDNFEHISKQELYKWRAVKHFKDHWDDSTTNFAQMLEMSLAKTDNLLHDQKMMARGTLILMAKKEPLKIKQALNILWDEDVSLEERYKLFSGIIRPIALELEGVNNHHHRHRAIFVYLCLKYPEKYFLYKYGMVEDAVNKLGYPLKMIKGRWSNVYGYFSLCKLILPIIRRDDELLRLHASRLNETCYQDPVQHLLVQDIIYAIAEHLDEPKIVNPKNSVEHGHTNVEPAKIELRTKVSTPFQIDFQTLNNFRSELGLSAELFVYKNELRKAKRIGEVNKVQYTARDEGDGAGYDIKSVDETGNEIFIEVKATTSDLEKPFFISRNELKVSKENKDKYFLYRVYDFDIEKQQGKIAIYHGSLDKLCNQPTTYISKLKRAN